MEEFAEQQDVKQQACNIGKEDSSMQDKIGGEQEDT